MICKNTPDWCVMITHIFIIFIIAFGHPIFTCILPNTLADELTGEKYYLFMPLLATFLWLCVHRLLKKEDNSVHYFMGIVYCATFITLASLSIDEIREHFTYISFENYFFSRILLNMLGLVGLPIFIAELTKIINSKPIKNSEIENSEIKNSETKNSELINKKTL